LICHLIVIEVGYSSTFRRFLPVKTWQLLTANLTGLTWWQRGNIFRATWRQVWSVIAILFD
jgi:hypothetical protein